MKKPFLVFLPLALYLIASCSFFLEDDNRQLYANDYATVLGDSVSQVLFFSDAGDLFQDTLYKDSSHFVGKRIRFEYKILNTKNTITFIKIQPNYLLFPLFRLDTKYSQIDTAIIHSLQTVNFTPKSSNGEFYLNVHATALVDTLNFSSIHILAEGNKYMVYYAITPFSLSRQNKTSLQSLNFSCDVGKIDKNQKYLFSYHNQSTQEWTEHEIQFIQEKK